jgi:hypothetical protein
MEEDIDSIASITYVSSERRAFVPVSYPCHRGRHYANRRRYKPGWLVSIDYDDGVLSFNEPSDFSRKRPEHIVIKNSTEVPHNIVIGHMH